MPKTTSIKGNSDKFNYINVKDFCPQITLLKDKDKLQTGKKYLEAALSDKGFVSRI